MYVIYMWIEKQRFVGHDLISPWSESWLHGDRFDGQPRCDVVYAPMKLISLADFMCFKKKKKPASDEDGPKARLTSVTVRCSALL